MSDDVVDVVRRNMDAWNRGDVAELVALAHPDLEWHPASTAALTGEQTGYSGPEGMRQWWREMHEAFDGLHNEIHEVRSLTRDTALVLGTLRGTGRAGGVPIAQPFGMLLEFEGGLFIRGRSWFDPEEALRAAEALAQSDEPE
jgi:ketosteroid isomerase-like protein